MRRRRLPLRWAVIGGGGLCAAIVVGLALVPNLRADGPAAPKAAFNRIGRANDDAAADAAAGMRERSRASADLRAAEDRGRDRAAADLRRANAELGNSI